MSDVSHLPDRLEFWFDPACPWTWATSRWLVEATSARGVPVSWRSLSLGVLNAGREVPEPMRAGVSAARSMHRVIASLRATGRDDAVGPLYTEYGRRIHHDGTAPSAEVVREVLDAAGVGDHAGAADDASWDADVEASTREAIDLAGPDVGSPVISIDEPRVAAFGPIVSPPPTGDAAVALFDHVVACLRMPDFYELKRGRRGRARFGPRP